MKKAFSIRQTTRKACQAFRCSFFQILWFEAICKASVAIVVAPLLTGILNLALWAGRRGFVANSEMLSFLLSPAGILAAAVLLILSVFFIYIEFSVVITLLYHGYCGRKVKVTQVLGQTLARSRDLLTIQTLGFGVYTLVILPLANMGIVSSLLPSLNLPNFVVASLSETLWGALLLLAFALAIFFAGMMLSYALPAMILERVPFRTAVVKSRRAMKKTLLKRFVMELVVVVVWFLLFLIPVIVLAVIIDVKGFLTPETAELFTAFGITWRSVVCFIAVVCIWVLQALFMPLMLAIVTVAYLELDDSSVAVPKSAAAAGQVRLPHRRLRRAAAAVLSVFAVVFAANMVNAITGFFAQQPERPAPVVMGHRGSLAGVENTLEAIAGAIEAGADYAEIDVQLSRDGVPVVVHDANLSRLTGEKRFVYDLTAQELTKIPLEQNGYTGHIPTLEQVIRYADGSIKLNIELKLHGYEEDDLTQKVMEVVEKENYREHCVFQSLSYELVQRMKNAYPSCRTGYIVYGQLGSPRPLSLMQLNIDFLAVEEGFATQKLATACRKADMPLYVWTVNDGEDMLRFWEMGVDGLITDLPDLARTKLEQAALSRNSP